MGSEGVSLVNLEISGIRKNPMKLFIQMCNYTQEYENQIDQLVYQLYGLTEEEIKIVEGETR